MLWSDETKTNLVSHGMAQALKKGKVVLFFSLSQTYKITCESGGNVMDSSWTRTLKL